MPRLIDADAYAAEMRKKQEDCRAWKDGLVEGTELYARAEQSLMTFVEAALTLKSQPTIDAIPVEWLEDKLNATAVTNPDLNNAIFYTLVAWEQQNHEQEAQDVQREYEAAVEMAEYCERYEPTFNAEDGSM